MTHRAIQPTAPRAAALSAAILLALQAMAAPAFAQTQIPPADAADRNAASTGDEAAQLDAIVVTYRASLQKALDTKRAAIGQVDAIIAEDIGKFPDLNLAESLQRIPGVSIARDAGEGRNISVRGLGPAFTRVRINGMEALTTTGGTDSSGGVNRGRGFDFNVFASELFNSLQVRKTASADVEEGSLGATVDLQTARPFDFDGFTFVTAAQMGYNDLSEESDPRGAALISNTWGDGLFGALFSLAYTDRTLVEEGHSTVRWDNGTSSGGFAPDSSFAPARLATTFHPRIPRYGVLEHEQERLGVTGSLQFQPADSTRFTLDTMYAGFDATRSENFLEAISFSRTGQGKPITSVLDGVIDARGNLVYGVFDNVDVRSEARYDELDTTFKQLGLNIDHEFSDTLRLTGLVGRSKSEFDNPIQTTITLDRADIDGFTWDYRDDDRLPLIDYGFDVTDPANWQFANGLSEIRLRPQTSDNTFATAQFELAWDVSESWRLRGGVLWKEYEFLTTEAAARLRDRRAQPAGRRHARRSRAPDVAQRSRRAERHRRGLGDSRHRCLRAAVRHLLQQRHLRGVDRRGQRARQQPFGHRGRFRPVAAGRVRGRIVRAAAARRFRRAARRHRPDRQRCRHHQQRAGRAQRFAQLQRHAALDEPGAGSDRRFPGALRRRESDVAARAGQPHAGRDRERERRFAHGDGRRSAARSVPRQDADLSFEWYFAEQSILSAALFYKDIDTFVQVSRETRPFNTSGLPESLLEGTGALPTDDFQFNIPINTPGGDLRGFEIAWQQPFTFLPEPFDGFGAILNYTYVESEIQYVTSTGANSLLTDLVGLSENAYNATLYWERGPFQARVSASYRDDYLTTVPGRNNADVEGTKDTMTVDFSASWAVNEQLEFTLEGINLTDEFDDQWVDSVGDRASVYHHTGRQYFAGVRWKF